MNCSSENTIPPSKLGVVIRSIGRAPTEAQLQSLCREFESKGMDQLSLDPLRLQLDLERHYTLSIDCMERY